MSDTDQLKPWAIKALPVRVADEITEAARTSVPRQTVGQLIERMWDHWQGSGTIVAGPHHEPARPMPTVDEVCNALDAVSKISHLGESVQLGVKNEANRLAKVLLLDLKLRMRQALAMPDQGPRGATNMIAAIDAAAETQEGRGALAA